MNMTEKLARDISDEIEGKTNWRDVGAPPDYYLDVARVALRCLLEPTAEMKAVPGVHWGYPCQICGGLEEGWQAMILEALKH